MLILLSPAKTLDFETAPTTEIATLPSFLEESQLLINQLQTLSVQEIASLMKLSDKLAALNVARYQSWQQPFPEGASKQALLAFKGDVYTGLEAETLSEHSLKYADKHLRILSGLYGLLRPLDKILPYRLEMGTSLTNLRGKNLYEFWGNQITDCINQQLQETGQSVVINLASQEYFKAVKASQLKAKLISPEFKDEKNGQYKIISFYAKKARGMMARYIIENQIESSEQLCNFDTQGYRYDATSSTPEKPVFLRDQQ